MKPIGGFGVDRCGCDSHPKGPGYEMNVQMNESENRTIGYYEQREAMRLLGHLRLLQAVVNDEDSGRIIPFHPRHDATVESETPQAVAR